jgi:hypothetical protein
MIHRPLAMINEQYELTAKIDPWLLQLRIGAWPLTILFLTIEQ